MTSKYRKADLHVHTPESSCYSGGAVSPGDIVSAALDAGLEIIAVTDHNSVAAVDDIREAGKKEGLYVFPGVEISTKSGHFLALFDPDTPLEELDSFLGSIGIERGGRGDAHTTAEADIEDILKAVRERGGIAIAAHIDRWPSGFLETKETRRKKKHIHENEYLDALEITIPQNKQAWNNGETRDFPRKHACLQGSDAHNPAEIARRPVYILMETVGLAELKAALVDYKNRILFPEEYDDAQP